MPVTSHDVARLAGVSQPTVSRALRDQRGVSAATRTRVRAAATSLGYVPSSAGRSLSTRTTGRIGVVSAELGNPFYPALLEPLQDRLGLAGYRTILVTDRGDEPVELEPLIDGSLDGVVLTTSSRTSPLPTELARRGLPFVLLNRAVDDVACDRCVVDNRAGAAEAARLLLRLGHRHIAAINGPSTTSTGHERAAGFEAELALAGRTPTVREVPFDADWGRQALLQLVTGNPGLTAVFCGNDVIALGALNAARSLGLTIPGDLTIVGFDDIPMAGWEAFELTTLRTDLAKLAGEAVQLLLDRIKHPDTPPREVRLQPILVERRSHGAPPRR